MCGLDASHRCTAIYIRDGIDTGEKVSGKPYYNSGAMKLTARQTNGKPGTFWIAVDPRLIKQRHESLAEIVGHEVSHIFTSEYWIAIKNDEERLAVSHEENICNVLGALLAASP